MILTTIKTLSTHDLSVGFENSAVLEDISIELKPGEIVAIGGPNGVGKSTLIKTMARQLKPIRGSVTLAGRSIWQYAAKEFAQLLAYVPQTFDGNLELTVEELLLLGRNPHQSWWQWTASSKDLEVVQHALTIAQLNELSSKLLGQLSGGERQRAAVATALVQEPTFLLLDEPTSNLDFKHQRELIDLLVQLRGRGLGVLIILHDLNMMAKLADRVMLMQKSANGRGQISVIGPVADVLTRENLLKVFETEIMPVLDPLSGDLYFNPFSTVIGTKN
jgi:iron complex transport system ATP-binding protein